MHPYVRMAAASYVIVYIIGNARQSLKLRRQISLQKMEIDRQTEIIRYLAHMLDDHEIEISEFDKIALSNIK